MTAAGAETEGGEDDDIVPAVLQVLAHQQGRSEESLSPGTEGGQHRPGEAAAAEQVRGGVQQLSLPQVLPA